MSDAGIQERHDTFYFEHGKCCAGCDWWQSYNSRAGECTRSAPMGDGRFAMLGMHGISLNAGAGHAFTPREHVCGEFKDSFDWLSLPLPYLKRIGFC